VVENTIVVVVGSMRIELVDIVVVVDRIAGMAVVESELKDQNKHCLQKVKFSPFDSDVVCSFAPTVVDKLVDMECLLGFLHRPVFEEKMDMIKKNLVSSYQA